MMMKEVKIVEKDLNDEESYLKEVEEYERN